MPLQAKLAHVFADLTTVSHEKEHKSDNFRRCLHKVINLPTSYCQSDSGTVMVIWFYKTLPIDVPSDLWNLEWVGKILTVRKAVNLVFLLFFFFVGCCRETS